LHFAASGVASLSAAHPKNAALSSYQTCLQLFKMTEDHVSWYVKIKGILKYLE